MFYESRIGKYPQRLLSLILAKSNRGGFVLMIYFIYLVW